MFALFKIDKNYLHKIMNLSTRKILSEYKTNLTLYHDFCYIMNNLLEDMLKKGNYKYHINTRVKDIASLSEKIRRKGLSGISYKHVQDIEDIVGMRVVFYTEMDRKKFLRKLHKEFKGSLKVEETEGPYGYSSTHVIASLGEKRSELSEYKRFEEMKCEIQLTLILTQAWAEIEHDILYKASSAVSKIDLIQYEGLKNRMERIMTQHIKKASFELENIIKEIKRTKVTRR